MINKKILNFQSYLLCLLPFSLLTGQLIPELIIISIISFFIYYSIKLKNWFYYKNKFFIIFILFCIYIVLRSIFSENPTLSLEASLFYFRFGFFTLGVWFLLNNKENLIKIFYYCLLVTFIVAVAEGYYQVFAYDSNLIGLDCSKTRLCLTLNDKLYLGGYLVRLFPLLLGLMLISRNVENKYLILVSIFICFLIALIFLSTERTAIALLILSLLLLMIMITKYKKTRIIIAISSVILLSITFSQNHELSKRVIDHTLSQVTESNHKDVETIISNQHDGLIFTALNMFTDKPLIGVGPKLFRYLCNDTKYKYNVDFVTCSTHPHNNYIQLLAETGIFGTLFMLIISTYILYLVINHFWSLFLRKQLFYTDFQISLIVCFCLTLFPFMFTQNFFNGWISIIYYLPLG